MGRVRRLWNWRKSARSCDGLIVGGIGMKAALEDVELRGGHDVSRLELSLHNA